MINTNNLVDKINTLLACGGLTSTQTCALNGALTTITNIPVVQVSTVSALPTASLYEGKLIYINDINEYRYSNGVSWVSDYVLETSVQGVWTWGTNASGQLGDNTTATQSSPISITGGLTDWCQVNAGSNHTVAVRTNGTLWAWGCNGTGRLGDGTVVDRSSPVSVIGGFTDWCQASAGAAHTAAVRQNGTLWAWGCNPSGQLGDNTTVSKSSPVSVVGGFTDWCQVSAGSSHTMAVRMNGTLWAWGLGSFGRLGDNTAVTKSSPVSVVGGFTDWCQVSAGSAHTAAVRANGTLWAWGCGSAGQLGNNSTVSISSPVSVVGGFADWCQVSAGQCHTTAIRTNGTLWAWGTNGSGRLGDNTTVGKSSPVSVVGGFTDWCQVSAGAAQTHGVRTNGTLWAWGINTSGVLGDNTTVAKSSPTLVVGGFTDWSMVSGSPIQTHAVAIRNTVRPYT